MTEYSDAINRINSAEKLLIGIGLEWQEKATKEDYEALKKIIGNKDYYIISLCFDDCIYQVFSEDEKVVTPCGGHRYLQCDSHIIKVCDAKKDGDKYICPECGEVMDYNCITNEKYLEAGYLKKFSEYRTWLTTTINKELCILELGADLRYPSVIRFAFDKVCMYNKKSTFYRVDEKLYQHTAEVEGRGISVSCDSIEFIKGISGNIKK